MAQIEFGTPFSQTAAGTTSAIATQAAVAGTTYYITDIAGSSDKAGSLLIVKDGTTVIWEVQLATASVPSFHETFKTPLRATSGNAVSVTIDGTSACYANIGGYAI